MQVVLHQPLQTLHPAAVAVQVVLVAMGQHQAQVQVGREAQVWHHLLLDLLLHALVAVAVVLTLVLGVQEDQVAVALVVQETP
jgi:hypothetical protein